MKSLLAISLIASATAIAAPPESSKREENPWVFTDKTAWINWKVVENPWRVVAGQTNFVPRAEGWYLVYSTVISRSGDRLLLEAVVSRGPDASSEKRLIMVRNYPDSPVDGDRLAPFAAKLVGDETYTSVLGAAKTVRSYDCGKACSAIVPAPIKKSSK